jgi:hypothetical protein
MVINPVVLGNKNDCAGEGHQQFNRPTEARESIVNRRSDWAVSSCCLATTSERTEHFMHAVVIVIYRVGKSMRLLQLFVVTGCKLSIKPIFSLNPMSSH